MLRLPGILAATALAALLACGNGGGTPPANPVDGLITAVGQGEIIVVLDQGGSFTFRISDPNVGVEHLEEHRAQRLPVRVTWEVQDGALLATRIDDA